MGIPENIKRERVRKRLSQSELGERTGIQQEHLSDLERGKHEPTVSTLRRIARACRVSVTKLIGE